MKKTAVLILFLAIALLVFGCSPRAQAPTGYATGQPQQQQYYGGGCGVAPADDTGAAQSAAEVSATGL